MGVDLQSESYVLVKKGIWGNSFVLLVDEEDSSTSEEVGLLMESGRVCVCVLAVVLAGVEKASTVTSVVVVAAAKMQAADIMRVGFEQENDTILDWRTMAIN